VRVLGSTVRHRAEKDAPAAGRNTGQGTL